jgi:hypothetical protein
MHSQFAAQANITFVAAWTSIRTQDSASNTYNTYLQAPSDGRLDSINYTCTWSDPTDDMISIAHELTFGAAIATSNILIMTQRSKDQLEAAPELLTQGQPEILAPNLTLVNRTIDQEVEVAMTFNETVYEAQPQWLAAAFTVIVMACLSIIPTYWGWWRLGRPVSMSPLEVAKAFDAPLMQQAHPNGTIDDHLRSFGDTRVRYGYHATVAEQLQSDITEQPSYLPTVNSTLNTTVIDRGSTGALRPTRPQHPSTVNASTSSTPMVSPTTPSDEIELQMLHSEPSPIPGMQSNDASTRHSLASSGSHDTNVRTQGQSSSNSALGTGFRSSRIHTRIEMRLRFAKE